MNRPLPNRPSEIDSGTRADDDRDPWSDFPPESTTEPAPARSHEAPDNEPPRPLSTPVKSPWAFTPRSLQLLTVDESDPADFAPEAHELVTPSRVGADEPEAAQPVAPPRVAAPEPSMARAEAPEPVYRYEAQAPPEPAPAPRDALARVHQPPSMPEATAAIEDDDQTLSLAAIVARQTAVRPAEAVATVRALCEMLGSFSDGSEGSALIPDIEDVLITADGRVTTPPGAGGDSDVRALGRILHALLQGTKTPLPLRLFVTASLSAHRYQSVEFFAEALSHYGGDNGAELIAALYKRASDSRAKLAPRAKTSLGQAMLRPPLVSAVSVRKPRTKAKAILVAVAAVLLSAVAAGLWQWRTAHQTSERAKAIDSRSTDSLRRTRDDWQLGLIDVPEFSPETVVTPPPTPPPAARRPSSNSAQPRRPVLNIPLVIPEPPPPPPPIPAVREPVRSVVDRRPPITEPIVAPPTYTDPKVYGRGDADVQPPVAQSPQALSQLLPDGPDGRPDNTLELVIDERGAVQSARLQNRPRTMAEGNTIQTAKMQKFRPALRSGTPVKYLLLVPLGTPR